MKKKTLRTNEYPFTVIYEPIKEGGFNVIFPAIPEICTFGRTLKEAKEMAKDALRCYLESALKSGEIIPRRSQPLKKAVRDEVAVSLSLK